MPRSLPAPSTGRAHQPESQSGDPGARASRTVAERLRDLRLRRARARRTARGASPRAAISRPMRWCASPNRPSPRRRRIAPRSSVPWCSRRSRPPPTAPGAAPPRSIRSMFAIEEKVALLLDANDAALKVAGAQFVTSGMFFLREEKTLATSDGTLRRADDLPFAAADDRHRRLARLLRLPVAAVERRRSPWGCGYEHVRDAKLVDNADALGRPRRCRSSAQGRWTSGATTSCSTPRTSGSRSTSRSRTPPSSIARWATRPTTPARASSRRPRRCSASSSTAPSS